MDAVDAPPPPSFLDRCAGVLYCPPDLLARDLSSLLFIVTGASSGIGRGTALRLCAQGAEVVAAVRTPDDSRCAALATECAALPGTLHVMRIDLASLDSVRDFAQAFRERFCGRGLHCLVNNGGVMATPKGATTRDGYEMQIGTNYIGPWLLTLLMIPALREAKSKGSSPALEYAPRVVNVSSSNAVDSGAWTECLTGSHRALNLDDPFYTKGRVYDGMAAYAQSKLCQILHVKELAMRYPELLSVAVHPGAVLTHITRTCFPYWIRVVFQPVEKIFVGQINGWAGIQSTLYGCLSEGAALDNGAFYAQHNSPRGMQGGWPMALDPKRNPQAMDKSLADRLWRMTRDWAHVREQEEEEAGRAGENDSGGKNRGESKSLRQRRN